MVLCKKKLIFNNYGPTEIILFKVIKDAMNPRLQNDHDLLTILHIKEIWMLYFWLLVISSNSAIWL
jgi:hypothetical protein